MLRTDASRRIIVATESTAASGGGDHLLRLLRWMIAAGADVELLALSDGPDPAEYGEWLPTTVLGRMQGPVAAAASVSGSSRLSQGLRGRQLRRWLRTRKDASFLIHHPRASSVLRFSEGERRAVAMFPDSSWSLSDLGPADRATLSTAAGWLVCDPVQSAEIEQALGLRAIEIGPLLHPEDLPPVTRSDEGGAIVLVPVPGSWTSVNHTIEIASALAQLAAGHQIRWIVDSAEDEWLADHDLVQAGLADRVTVVSEGAVGVLDGVGAVVCSGYGTSSSPSVVAARLAGVPVLGFSPDASPALGPVSEFDVEGLVRSTAEILVPGEADRRGVVPGAGFGPDSEEVVDGLLSWLDFPRSERGQLSGS